MPTWSTSCGGTPLPDRYGAQELLDAEACRQQDEMSEAELLDRAMAFLTGCAAVGFADRLDDFAALVASRLGWAPPQPLGLRNSAPAGEPRYQLSDAEREAVLERDAVDVRLVDRARREFGGVWDAEGFRSRHGRRGAPTWRQPADDSRVSSCSISSTRYRGRAGSR